MDPKAQKGWLNAAVTRQDGLTLLETLIAAFILLFVLLSMISSFTLGRRDIDQEEIKRKATAIAMDRIETIRARYASDPANEVNWDRIDEQYVDTTYVVDQIPFTLTSAIAESGGVKGARKTIALNVSWTARKHNNAQVTRKVQVTTDISRMLPVVPPS